MNDMAHTLGGYTEADVLGLARDAYEQGQA